MNPSPTNWKEARRLQAWQLKHKGWSQRQTAAQLARLPALLQPGAEA